MVENTRSEPVSEKLHQINAARPPRAKLRRYGAGGTESSGGSGTSITPSAGGRFTRGRGAGAGFTVGVGCVGRLTFPGSIAAAVNDGITIEGVGGADTLGTAEADGMSTGSDPVIE